MEYIPIVYAAKHTDLETRMNSRSGGIFTALSDDILEKGGVVYGCILDEHFKAIHVRAETAQERDKMRGSKYIESNLGNTFAQVKKDLESGRYVLFSGTSCQIAGLRSYLSSTYSNLFCVDIVCHGVPSPKVWEKYLNWQENRINGQCIVTEFRNKKKFGWSSHVETLTIRLLNGKEYTIHSEIFKELFYGHNILRPSCYYCPYKTINHPGDITIADYWGIDKAAPGFNDNHGVSLVLINNKVGEQTFKSIKNSITYQTCSLEDSMQPSLIRPFLIPKERDEFWRDFRSKSFEYIARKYGGYGNLNKIKHIIKKLIKKITGRISLF